MKFQVGDKVRFLNEKGEGTVVKIMANGFVQVEVEDGFEFPFPEKELVKAFQADTVKPATVESVSTEIHPVEIKREFFLKKESSVQKDGIFLAFEVQNNNQLLNSDLSLYFINNTALEAHFSYGIKSGSEISGVGVYKASPEEKVLLSKVKRGEVEKFSTLKIQIIFFKKGPFVPVEPIDEIVKIKPVKFYKEHSYQETSFTDNKAIIINLRETEEEEAETAWNGEGIVIENLSHHVWSKEREHQAKKSKQHINNTGLLEKEVDLHIEELIDNFKGMSNAEIIQIQLKHFQNELDQAIASHMHRIVFIHGVGNGRLKHEVQRVLKGYTGVRFHDASYHRYGFGATEVIIK